MHSSFQCEVNVEVDHQQHSLSRAHDGGRESNGQLVRYRDQVEWIMGPVFRIGIFLGTHR
jgi:hypothetical protein